MHRYSVRLEIIDEKAISPVNQSNQQIEMTAQRINAISEKVSLLSGSDAWHTVAIERLGIRPLTMTDGPHGVRASNPELGRLVGPTTCFPTGISMGASWDPELVGRGWSKHWVKKSLAMEL